jgi:hypothetical protein
MACLCTRSWLVFGLVEFNECMVKKPRINGHVMIPSLGSSYNLRPNSIN